MPARVIAIGDIHGCLAALDTLLEAIQIQSDDQLIFLGDYVDRGPDSCGVIDRVLELERHCQVVPVLGNHEEMMWMVLSGQTGPMDWLRYGGVATLDSYGFSGDLDVVPESHRDLLQRCLDFYENDTHFFLHANYDESTPLAELDVETLRWRSLQARLPGPHRNGKMAIVGHTAQVHGTVLDLGYLKCLDTYCYGGQWLTALDVKSGQFWQANQEGETRQD